MPEQFPPYPSRGPRVPGPQPGPPPMPGDEWRQPPGGSPFSIGPAAAPPPPPKPRTTFAALVGRHPRKSLAVAFATGALIFGAVNSAEAEPEPVGLLSTPSAAPGTPTPTRTQSPTPTPTPSPTPAATPTPSQTPAQEPAQEPPRTTVPARPSPTNTQRQPFADTGTSSRPTTQATRTQAQSSGGGAASYRNCSEVRAAGKAPIYRGQPGYASHLDRDNDGVACE